MSALSILWFLLGALDPQDCGPDQDVHYIPQSNIWACSTPYINRFYSELMGVAA